jgi:DNA-binding protein H-NS
MSDFLNILTHGRKLQGATKELSIAELQLVSGKLNTIIKQRRTKETAVLEKEKQKQNKLDIILKQIEEAGLEIKDFEKNSKLKKSSLSAQKRPIKYKFIKQDGTEVLWTGVGRMPLVFVNALANGNSLNHYSINP